MNHPIQQESNAVVYKSEGMPTFEVGMRVRIRFSGECNFTPSGSSPAGIMHARNHEATMEANGKTGCIREIVSSEYPSHPYSIELDETFYWNGNKHWRFAQAAASELIPVEDLCEMEDDAVVCERGTHGCSIHEPVIPLEGEGR